MPVLVCHIVVRFIHLLRNDAYSYSSGEVVFLMTTLHYIQVLHCFHEFRYTQMHVLFVVLG